MSQAGIVDFIGTHPEIPILFVADVGSAIPIANTLEILGGAVTAHGVPLQTDGSGNTITINVQYASAAASSVAGNAGVASFDSAVFTVDANGFVSLTAVAGATKIGVDAFTAPGTNPVLPNGSGIITVTGGQVAAGTTTNVIQTNSLAANTYTIQIQRSSAQGSSTIGANGVSHFNSTYFTVDANGFVSINGSAIGETITGNTGGALSPTAGNWNILGTSVAAGTTPVQTSGSVSTLTVQVQRAQAIASTNATNVGLAAFNSTYFTVDSNGFVSINGSAIGETITGQSGGALSPTAGNWNIFGASTAAGTSPVSTSGTGSTLTVNVQKAQAIASTNATNVGLAAFSSAAFSVDANGFVTLSGTGAGQTITGNTGGALSPTAGNWNIVGTGSITTSGSASTLTVQLTGLTNHNVLVGAGTATITNVAPSATSGVPLISQGSSADPAFGTAVVAGGGTGVTSFTAYAPVCGGTTTTGALQSASTGLSTAGYMFTSTGGSSLPNFQIPTNVVGWQLVYYNGGNGALGGNPLNIDLTSIIATGINAFMINFRGIFPGSNGDQVYMRFSENSGSSFATTNYQGNGQCSAYNTATWTNTYSTTFMPISKQVSTVGNGWGLNGTLWLWTSIPFASPGAALQGQTNVLSSVGGVNPIQTIVSAFYSAATGVNAIQFTSPSGLSTIGAIAIYGMKA